MSFPTRSGVPKLFGAEAAVDGVETIGCGQWFRYGTGVVEIAGGIGLLVPRLVGPAAVGLAITMICASLTQVFLLVEPSLMFFPLGARRDLRLDRVAAPRQYYRRPGHVVPLTI